MSIGSKAESRSDLPLIRFTPNSENRTPLCGQTTNRIYFFVGEAYPLYIDPTGQPWLRDAFCGRGSFSDVSL